MKKMMVVIGILTMLSLLFTGCTDYLPDDGDDGDDGETFDLAKTFSCNGDAVADMHLAVGTCSMQFHAYNLGERMVLERIEGTVRIVSSGAGSASVLIYMSDDIGPQFGDLSWIRVRCQYNVVTSFDNLVYPTRFEYKTKGSYLILGVSSGTTLGLSEGTAYFSYLEDE